MPMPKKEIDFNKIYQSNNYGEFEILEELEPIRSRPSNTLQRRFKIRFLQTGTESIVGTTSIEKGAVKDIYYPNCAGVGYLGNLDGLIYDKKIYDMWRTMIIRCYDATDKRFNGYGAKGITVDKSWHCFANFLNDFYNLPGYMYYASSNDHDKSKFHLDKDYLQQDIPVNKRIYSKNTCMLIPNAANSRLSSVDYKKANSTSSKYFGVYKINNTRYQCRIDINKTRYFLGTYDDEIAAANMYNHVIKNSVYAPTLNNVPYMNFNECLSHKLGKSKLELPSSFKNIIINNQSNYNNMNSYEWLSYKTNTNNLVEMCKIIKR